MTISAEQREVLGEAAGEAGLEEHAPLELEGAQLEATLRPRDAAALARVLVALARFGLPALVRGGGSRLGLGNPAPAARVLLETGALTGVDEFDSGEGVCHAGAGTPLADLRAKVRAGGWELPLDPPGRGATLGGVLAAAALGPRALGFGAPRDLVLGLEVVLGSGERTRCGGRVVKNVTGYDLNKLHTGALGSLGVIEAAWLRLRPLPERVAVFEARPARLEGACALGLAAARRVSARAVALTAPEPGASGGPRLVVELAGDAPSVARDAEWLHHELAAEEAGAEALDEARALQVAPGLRFRISCLASRMDAALAALREEGATLLAYPGLGLLYAVTLPAPSDASATQRSAQRAAEVARGAGGSAVLEQAPVDARRGLDVFGAAEALLPLHRSLKSRFDPAGILNPGRFMGQL